MRQRFEGFLDMREIFFLSIMPGRVFFEERGVVLMRMGDEHRMLKPVTLVFVIMQ
jgi:hypothetical protein